MTSVEMEKRFNNGISYRAMTMEIRKAEESGENKEMIVEGYATTFNEPYILGENDDFRVREQVLDTAFDSCDLSDVIMQYDHCGRVYARTGNGTLTLTKDEHGLKVRANLGGTTEGHKLYEEIKGGYTTKMSFGFTITDEEELRTKSEDGKDDYLYTIKSIGKLYDVSAVSLPANDGTEISARKRFDAEVARRNAEAQAKAEEEKRIEAEKRAQEEKEKAEAKAKWLFLQSNK